MRLSETASRPKRVEVILHGEPYWLNVSACRRALVSRRAAGDIGSVSDVADRAGLSRSTVSRLLNGHRGGWSIDTVRAILDVLRLPFESVVTPRVHGR